MISGIVQNSKHLSVLFPDEDTLRALLDAMKAPSIVTVVRITMVGGVLHCEGEAMAEYDGALPGFLLWAAAHTVFAQTVAGSANVVLQFIQRTCLNVKEVQSASCKVRSLKMTAFLDLQ